MEEFLEILEMPGIIKTPDIIKITEIPEIQGEGEGIRLRTWILQNSVKFQHQFGNNSQHFEQMYNTMHFFLNVSKI